MDSIRDRLDQIMEEIPESDVVQVVRCKNCEYWKTTYCITSGTLHGLHPNAEFYCAWGKKRDIICREDSE